MDVPPLTARPAKATAATRFGDNEYQVSLAGCDHRAELALLLPARLGLPRTTGEMQCAGGAGTEPERRVRCQRSSRL